MLRRIKHVNYYPNLTEYLREYADITDIHGVRYLTEKRTLLEKAFWAIITVAFFGAGLLILGMIYSKWQLHPILIAPDPDYTPLDEFPFPVVTVCPESRVAQENFKYTTTHLNIIEKNFIDRASWRKFQHLWVMCDHVPQENCGKLLFRNKTAFYHDINLLKRNMTELFHGCKFGGKHYNCSELLFPVLTEEGVCFSFNSLDRRHIFKDHVNVEDPFSRVINTANDYHPDNGYKYLANSDAYPRRIISAGMDYGLEVITKIETDHIGTACKSALRGFRVLVHQQFELPRPNEYYFRVTMNNIVLGDIQPKSFHIGEIARKYHPFKRHCYLQSEFFLAYYKVYSFANCYMECLANYTIDECGCVPFYMPRTKDVPLCGSGKYICTENADLHFHFAELAIQRHESDSERGFCNCMPSCSEMKYSMSVSHSQWNWRKYITNPEFSQHLHIPIAEDDELSILKLFIRNRSMLRIRRSQLYTLSQFFSQFGGIVSLFVGISIISFLEVIYFCTGRLLMNKRLHGSYTNSGDRIGSKF